MKNKKRKIRFSKSLWLILFALLIIICIILFLIISNSGEKYVIEGKKKYRGFVVDNVMNSKDGDVVHYSYYLPKNYSRFKRYSLFISLSGYGGLYSQGLGENLYSEDIVFSVIDKYKDVIVLSPQLNDYGESSANQVIELIEYFLKKYSINKDKIVLEGYSTGGETGSLVVSKRPGLFYKYLHLNSIFVGDYSSVVNSQLPVYIVIGENDEYYGTELIRDSYNDMYYMYKDEGMSEDKISELLIFDLKNSDYYGEGDSIHSSINIYSKDKKLIEWLFS